MAARLLLEKGATRTTRTASTALMGACHGHVEAARLLLEKGAAVDAKMEDGATALMLACLGGDVARALLLEKDADRTLPTSGGGAEVERKLGSARTVPPRRRAPMLHGERRLDVVVHKDRRRLGVEHNSATGLVETGRRASRRCSIVISARRQSEAHVTPARDSRTRAARRRRFAAGHIIVSSSKGEPRAAHDQPGPQDATSSRR